jgi:glycerol kinase
MTLIFAIDQSTSATKAVVFDAAGEVVDRASREHRQIYPQPGWVEHDAEEIWQNTLAVLGEVAARQTARWTDVIGLSIANQRETFVVFDRRSGQPLHNAIVWQCRRGDDVCRALREAGHEPTVHAKTGLKLDAYFSGSKLRWLVDSKPEIAAKLRGGDALIGTIDAYLVHRLTHGGAFVTDPTNASRTLLYDARRLQWDGALCDLFGAPPKALPEVRESFARFGDTDGANTLPGHVPICGVMGDSQASLFAQRCFTLGAAKATLGSGTSVMINAGDTFKSAARGAVSALAWVRDGKPTYALEGLINYSSATVAWLRDQVGLIHDASETESLAASVPDNGGTYLVPAFAGLSAPYWSPGARAALVGMTAYTRREHIVRAALESIAYQIRDILDMIRGEAGVTASVLHADGGPTRNAFLMQFVADITRLELDVPEIPESSAWGAASAGLLGLGVYQSLEELAAAPRPSRRFRPKMNHDVAERFQSEWRTAVERTL